MKRLLCFFDGTWNVPDGRADVTNVVKLARVALGMAPDGTPQITRYIEGIGTDPGDGEYEAFVEGAIGVGLDRRIMDGLRFLAERYEPGDEIYLFGFSRGAFQARSLAGLIARIGLPRSEAATDVEVFWEYYRRHRWSPDEATRSHLVGLCHPGARIRCLGVWDTVGNLGIPLVRSIGFDGGLSFHDTEISPIIDVGLQALAIDEPRGPFSPSLWTRRAGDAPAPNQVVEQVWFPGSHANVGGGYPNSGLSDIALLWMAERVSHWTGVAFDLERLRRETTPDPHAVAVSPTSDLIFRASWFLPFVRLIDQRIEGITPWRRLLLGRTHTSALPTGLQTVNEAIHPSVMTRLGARVALQCGTVVRRAVYRPRTLRAALGRGRRLHTLGRSAKTEA